MAKLQERLEFLLEKYSVSENASFNGDEICISGIGYPLLHWRQERRFIELKGLVDRQLLGNISLIKIMHICDKKQRLNDILIRELDIAEFISGRKTEEIFAINNKRCCNIIAKQSSGIIVTIEIGATLSEGEKAVSKHEIITDRGVACDMVVDSQVAQQSIYVFGQKNKEYTDVDNEIFGLSIEDTAKVRYSFELAKNKELRKTVVEQYKHLQKLLKAFEKSTAEELSIRI